MNDEIKFKCAECGKEFEPDPDSMVELHWSPQLVKESEAEALEDSGQTLTNEALQAMDVNDLRELGLTPTLRDKMLRGEEITGGGMCICRACQDRMLEEQHGESA